MSKVNAESQLNTDSGSASGESVKKLAFVTGASGFVGKHLVPELVAQGFEVRCLVRRALPSEFSELAGVTEVLGDLHDLDVLRV